MTAHHDRVRAVLLVAGLEADRRVDAGDPPVTVNDLTAHLARIQVRLDRLRSLAAAGRIGDKADAERWKLAVYDAALAELCGRLGLRHSIDDAAVSSEAERQRIELELVTSVLPLRS